MRIFNFEYGKFYSRQGWAGRQLALCIPSEDNSATYYNNGHRKYALQKVSHVRNYDDFVECDRYGKIIKKQKEPKMDYKKITVVVTTSDGRIFKFENEEDALEKIADILEANPRTKFTMFKPYQKVEPKRTILTDLITKITS